MDLHKQARNREASPFQPCPRSSVFAIRLAVSRFVFPIVKRLSRQFSVSDFVLVSDFEDLVSDWNIGEIGSGCSCNPSQQCTSPWPPHSGHGAGAAPTMTNRWP